MNISPGSRWRQKATALGRLLPRARLHPAALAWAAGRQGTARGCWTAAFSGGADSLALLLLLWAHWPERRGKLVALHFNHRQRGRAADADEQFCRKVCAALGVRLRVGRWRQARRGASEEEARAARFAFFERAMRRVGSQALWLGHHQNDIAETMLMRLARGSGAAGLAAPRPVQCVADRVHLRPVLTLKKREMTAALRTAGVSWREDQSNAAGGFFRNRIRLRVLPAWHKAAGRDALAGAALTRELLEEDDAALEHWLDEIQPFSRGGFSLDVRRLSGKPRALIRRALRRWLAAQPLAGELSRQGFEDLLAAVVAGQPARRSLGRRGFAVIRHGILRFVRTATGKKSGRK